MGIPMPWVELARAIEELRFQAGNAQIAGTDNLRLNKMVLWYSKKLLGQQAENSRVAISAPLLRASPSPCWNCKNCKKDCEEKDLHLEPVFSFCEIPALLDLERKASHEKQEKMCIRDRYKKAGHEDYWLLNHDFYNADIEDLKYIANLVGAKEGR